MTETTGAGPACGLRPLFSFSVEKRGEEKRFHYDIAAVQCVDPVCSADADLYYFNAFFNNCVSNYLMALLGYNGVEFKNSLQS